MSEHIAVIDLKSFYASVECVMRGLDPLEALLVVCDTSRGEGTIVLSASPKLKELYGVKNVQRKRELPEVPGLIFATPRMETYVKVSADVVATFMEFVGEDDIHVYSIDESFLNLGPYLKLYNCTARQLTKRIMDRVYEKLGLRCTAGIGPNFILAKCALDNAAKKAKDFIAEWNEKDIKSKLWKLKPVSKMWGINVGIERRLNKLGIFDVETLANYPVDRLEKEFGIIGTQLKEHANGIDDTNIREKYSPKETSLSLGQVLMRDYNIKEAKLIVKEMVDDLCLRMRTEKKKTKSVSIFVMYSMEKYGGFAHQTALNYSTDNENVIYEALMTLYDEYVEDLPIRRININFAKLEYDDNEQVDLFIGAEEQEKRKSLSLAMDEIKMKYGKNSVLRMSSLTEESTAKERHNQIGGHKK